MSDKQDELRPIIIKKIKKSGASHHGGAWKVAYADFVTAMMAFFLLLWLLSVTTEVQKDGIAEYFTSTPMITRSESGAGGILGGTTIELEGAMTSKVKPLIERPATQDPALKPGSIPPTKEANITEERLKEAIKEREQENFDRAAEAIKKAINATPELKEMANALKIDMTTEGLRIQIVDEKDKPLFNSGSSNLLPHTKELLEKVAEVVKQLPNELSVRGHTDSVPYGSGNSYTNWELSAERANAARRELVKGGMPANRVNNVVGKADTDHLFPQDSRDPRNRRISIILLHNTVTTEEGANKSSRAVERDNVIQKNLYEKTEGRVTFP